MCTSRPPTERPALDGRNVLPWIAQGWLDAAHSMDCGRTLAHARLDASRAATRKPAAVVERCGNYEVNHQGKVVPREGQLVADLPAYCQRKRPGNGVGPDLCSMLDDAQVAAPQAGPFKEDAAPSWLRRGGLGLGIRDSEGGMGWVAWARVSSRAQAWRTPRKWSRGAPARREGPALASPVAEVTGPRPPAPAASADTP